MKQTFHSLLLVGSLFLATGNTSSRAASSSGDLTVFAAASLKDVFEDLDRIFEHRFPGVHVVLSLGGSQKLSAQLQQGAPADVFASAAQRNMDEVVAAGLVSADSVRVFARNWLVVVYSPKKLAISGTATLGDLAKPGIKLVVADKSVPAGAYTEKMLEKAQSDSRFGSQFCKAFRANIVSFETDVRSVLNKVALGEADAGVVYQSDLAAHEAASLRSLQIPQKLNVEAEYPVAVLSKSPNTGLARRFVELLLSDRGKIALKQHGFPTP